jgi:3'(2'), 5'-bisphosphate nucleotidase
LGLVCSGFVGGPLVYNRADTYMPDLLICRPEWAHKVLEAVAQLR